jgi:hypothetical protein
VSNTVTDESKPPMSALTKHRNWILMIVCTVVIASLIIVASVHLFYYERAGVYAHQYYVCVETNDTAEYTIRLPVPNDDAGTYPLSFLEDIDVLKGEPEFELGIYGHGTGLEVRASGNLEFEWNKAWPESAGVRYGNLTMTTGAEGWTPSEPAYSWIFSDRSDIRIQFLYTSIHHYMSSPMWASGGGPTFGFIEYPNGTGWQQMRIDYGWMVIN